MNNKNNLINYLFIGVGFGIGSFLIRKLIGGGQRHSNEAQNMKPNNMNNQYGNNVLLKENPQGKDMYSISENISGSSTSTNQKENKNI